MKQSFYAIGMLMLIAFQTSAQKSETAFFTKTSVANNPFLIEKAEAKAKTNAMAEERFRKDFKDVQNVEWTEKADGYRVYFTKDNIITAVDYSNKGNMYSVIRYGKSLLPKYETKLINNKFNKAVVREVSEVKIAEYSSKVYVVILEDATSMKTIQLMEGEITVLQEESK
jgi:hypothetical protein